MTIAGTPEIQAVVIIEFRIGGLLVFRVEGPEAVLAFQTFWNTHGDQASAQTLRDLALAERWLRQAGHTAQLAPDTRLPGWQQRRVQTEIERVRREAAQLTEGAA